MEGQGRGVAGDSNGVLHACETAVRVGQQWACVNDKQEKVGPGQAAMELERRAKSFTMSKGPGFLTSFGRAEPERTGKRALRQKQWFLWAIMDTLTTQLPRGSVLWEKMLFILSSKCLTEQSARLSGSLKGESVEAWGLCCLYTVNPGRCSLG